ncbi:MAG: bifunctional tetrahydrofolate synthase/dihydrofolate synthase [Amphritea sp.]
MSTVELKNLEQWLSWIEKCHPSEIDLGLQRLQVVFDRMQLDLSASQIITIGGTNGKGSTIALLDKVLRDYGQRVGCFTSPHFLRYNERVKLDGRLVEDELLCRAFEAIERVRGDLSLTYFEYNTLAALHVFAMAKPDVILLEVGLGGRLDAVNIIDADISVVTTVAIDHIDWLGDDREQIGFEKAGIFRAGCPAVCGDPEPPKRLVAYAAEIGAQLYSRGQAFNLTERADGLWDWQGTDTGGGVVQQAGLLDINLPKANAATVLQVLELLDIHPEPQQLAKSLANACLTGRMQRVSYQGQEYILDVAHNPEAAAYLRQQLEKVPVTGKTLLILGMLADKDIDQVLQELKPVVDSWLLATLSVPRGEQAVELADKLQRQGVAVDQQTTYDSVRDALLATKGQVSQGDRIIVAGSFYTVGNALTAMNMDE